MKELTTEQKAKAYDEALEKARAYHKSTCLRNTLEALENIFPELAESDDETIRKELITHCRNIKCVTEEGAKKMAKWLAWLEKQGEQKPADKAKPFDKYEGLTDFERTLADICIGWIGEELGWKQYIKDNANVLLKIAIEKFNSVQDTPFEQKPIIEMKSAEESLGISSEEYNDIVNEYLYGESESSDKVELKFKVGDWITNGDYTWKIIEVKPLDYILQSQDGNIVDDTISHVDEQFHSFTIKDAKDGDVLATDKSVFIYAKTLYNKPYAYCGVDKYGVFKDNCLKNNWANSVNNILPANKEQRDTLMKAMADAGYEWNAEKKELKKIEQKSAWSEEDVKKIDRAIWLIEHDASHGWIRELREDVIFGLKSLKQKIKTL